MTVTSVAYPMPRPAVVLELLKPITWFAPMWAFSCGVVSSGVAVDPVRLVAGLLVAGPLVCAASQAANDWYDRDVDAINEPNRPIPSGRLPGRWGLYVAILWTGLSLVVATLLGAWGFGATVLALVLAWAYSAPPFRFKREGWLGNFVCGASYETLPWFTGAAVMLGTMPDGKILALAALYGIGAHGIMTLNDFKSVEGDLASGVRSLPARLGVRPAAILACVTMAGSQVAVIALLVLWSMPIAAGLVTLLLLAQLFLMRPLLAEPKARAAWYNATGTSLSVLGMMVAAVALALQPAPSALAAGSPPVAAGRSSLVAAAPFSLVAAAPFSLVAAAPFSLVAAAPFSLVAAAPIAVAAAPIPLVAAAPTPFFAAPPVTAAS